MRKWAVVSRQWTVDSERWTVSGHHAGHDRRVVVFLFALFMQSARSMRYPQVALLPYIAWTRKIVL
jgi:hypothetical protein